MAAESHTRAVGTKFHEDGQVRHFPGNTVVSHILENNQLFNEVIWAQSEIMRLPFSSKYSFLPPHSFHMTVFELLCDQVRDQEHWSGSMDMTVDLRETDMHFENAVNPIKPPKRILMKYDGIRVERNPSIRLAPADEKESATLRAYRNELSEATGVRFPNHDQYKYHISLAYLLLHLTDAEQEQGLSTARFIETRLRRSLSGISIPIPVITYFDHMHAFHRSKARTARWA
jgi:hypothetical protein